MANNEENNEQKNVNNLAKYSALAFQMVAIIGVFTFIGMKLDDYTANRQHLYTAILSLAGVLLALLQVIRQARKG